MSEMLHWPQPCFSTAAAGKTPAFSMTLLDRENFLSTELKASYSKQSLALAVTGNLPLLITVMEPVIIFMIQEFLPLSLGIG